MSDTDMAAAGSVTPRANNLISGQTSDVYYVRGLARVDLTPLGIGFYQTFPYGGGRE